MSKTLRPSGTRDGNGEKGVKGEKGAPGSGSGNGEKGQKGEVGTKGDVGTKGQKGQVGGDGTKGDTGTKGQKGQVGDVGAKGDAGTKGTKGEAGSGGDGSATGTLEARVERVNFDDLATGTANAELTPNALSVVNGSGDNELVSDISGNDFTLAAGVYLVNIHASFTLTQNSVVGFALRRASDNAELDQSNPLHPRQGTAIWSARALVVLAADTAVNVLLKRTGAAVSAVHAEFVQLSSGGAVQSSHNRYIGWAAQQTPSATEIAAADTFQADVLTIPAEPADGDGWLWFAVPDDAGAPDSAYFDGNTHDILGGFTRLAANTFAGHIVYATSAEQDPADLGTGDRTLTLEYD